MDAQLRAAWCDVLGLETSDISNDSNFFTKGGDSVTAMRLVTAVRERNIALDAHIIFQYPEFMDMAKHCRLREPDNESGVATRPVGNVIQACAEICGVQPDLIEDVFPATDFQLMVFHQHIASGAMMLQTVFEIVGAFDRNLLHQVWQLLHDKNQILRTRLVEHGDQLLQVVVNDTIQWGSDYNLARYKASDMSKRVRSGDALFRYATVSEGEKDFLVWTCHHGGFDGWTRRLIMDKFQEVLSDLTRLTSEPHGPTFKSFVTWTQSQSYKKSKAAAFWEEYLDGYRILKGIQSPSPNYVPLISSQLCKTIEVRRIVESTSAVTLSTLGHAAWAVAIGSLWNVDDVLFVTVKMGRQMARDSPLSKVESIMGPMMTVNPVRAGLGKDTAVEQFLKQMQHQLIATTPFEHEGFLALMQRFGRGVVLPGMIDWHPLGSDIFSRILQHKAQNGETSYIKPRRDLSVNFTINSSMLVDIYEHQGYLDLRVSYDASIWEEKLVGKLVDSFADILTKMLLSREYTVGELLSSGAAGTTVLKSRL
ncbi:condensation domain-containing protein [Usnea florida]